jgi:hypothetical protein
MDKECNWCHKIKSLSSFPKDKTMKSGYKNICKDCVNIWRKKNPHRCRATRTISGHKLQGMKVEITTSELEQLLENTTNCSICGIELKPDLGEGYYPNSPSVDRLNNETTLNIDNIWVVCRKCNTTKQNRSMKEFYHYCEFITNKFKKIYGE